MDNFINIQANKTSLNILLINFMIFIGILIILRLKSTAAQQ